MGRRLIIISCLMLFLAGFLPSRGASRIGSDPQLDSLPIRRAVELTTDGQKRAMLEGDLAAADSLFRLSIAEDSTYSPAYFALSQLFSQRRESIDSIVKYTRRAYELDTLNGWYTEAYAQALAVSGNYPLARLLYRKSIDRKPQELSSYLMVAMLYRHTGENEAALSLLDSAEMRTGKNSYLSSLKREILISMGERDKAIAEVKELVESDPTALENRLMLADLYISTKQDSLARIQFEEAIAIDSTSVMVLDAAVKFYADQGAYPDFFRVTKLLIRSSEESLENKVLTFRRLTSDRSFYGRHFYSINEIVTQLYLQHSTNKSVVELYAEHLIAGGSLDKALELYKKHAQEDLPAQYDYYSTIIDIESYLQRSDSVEMYASRAIELFPDRHELRLSQANLYAYTKRYDTAIESYQAILSEGISDTLQSSIWGSIGDLYHQKSIEDGVSPRKARSFMRSAYKAYDQALKLNRANVLVLNNYAYFLSLERRDLERALDMSGRAIAIVEGSSTYLDTYAWILYELERYEEAKKIMRQVIALDTTQSAEIQFHYAEILAALGENFMAEIYYDKALKLGYDTTIIDEKKAKLK